MKLIIWILLGCLSLFAISDDIDILVKRKEKNIQRIGEKVLINKDTLSVVDYGVRSIKLSNDMWVSDKIKSIK